MVHTSEGLRPIQSIEPGDTVITLCEESQELVDKRVVKTMQAHANELIYVELDNGETIVTTRNHRFLTDIGWVKAASLFSPNRIRSANKETATVVQVRTRLDSVVVNNIEVEDNHNYCIATGWIVHNMQVNSGIPRK